MDNELITRNTETTPELVERADGKREIAGYGALYYDGTSKTEFQLGDNLYERVAHGAFDRCLAEGQVVQVRYNHSPDWVLADTTTGAVVRTDQKGLRYSVPFDSDDPQHQTVRSKLEKGLIKGSSFGALHPTYRYADEGGKHVAWLTSVRILQDCSPVNSPAYKGAPAMLRSAEEGYHEWLKAREETRKRIEKIRK
jgi:HK97 family phage prohead protease